MDAKFEAMVRYKRGMDLRALTAKLITEGCEPNAAEEAVLGVANRIRAADRKTGFATLGFGLLIFGIGTGITLWTMQAGNVVVYSYGAVLVGGGMIFAGLAQISNAGKQRLPGQTGL